MSISNRALTLALAAGFFASTLTSSLAQEGMGAEAVAAADNTPSECVDLADVKLADGQSVQDYAKKRGITPNAVAKPRLKPETADKVGAKVLTGEPVSNRRTIDGPANLRDKPAGKVLYSFENSQTMLLLAVTGDWYLVRGYYARPCDSGWTHKKNIKPYNGNPK